MKKCLICDTGLRKGNTSVMSMSDQMCQHCHTERANHPNKPIKEIKQDTKQAEHLEDLKYIKARFFGNRNHYISSSDMSWLVKLAEKAIKAGLS